MGTCVKNKTVIVFSKMGVFFLFFNLGKMLENYYAPLKKE